MKSSEDAKNPAKEETAAATVSRNNTVKNDNQSKTLNIFYNNIDGLKNKLDELKNCVNIYNPDIICIVESKLHSDILDCEIAIPNFSCFRNDRAFKIGGCDNNIIIIIKSI